MHMKLIVLILLSVVGLCCKSQTEISRIEIIEPTIQDEATSIWRTINDYAFFEKQGYTINLPQDSLIDSLIMKSKNGTFGNDDFAAIYTLLETTIFDKNNYKQAKQKVEDEMELMNAMIHEIDTKKKEWDWKCNMFETYKVVFTLYGTGGSYDPDEGVITLLTNAEGGFMKYKNPAYTIIHEITHMGMEHSIVRKYNLSHGLKERIVDTFVLLMFQEKLPHYKIQDIGDKEIDKYLATKKDIASMNSIVSEFVNR